MSPRLLALGAGAILLAAAGFGAWWFFFNDDNPPPVSLDDALAGLTTATATATQGGVTATAEATTAASATADPGEVTLEGTWSVAPQSFVGYRIEEELANFGAATAVGRTFDVSGTLEFDGAAITSVSVVANLQDLESDDSRRDGQLRRQSLETNEFPEATFVLAEPIALASVPAEGEPIAATAVGDLTIHGVTNRVSLDLEGQLEGGNVVVVGSTVIVLADYGIEQPRSNIVLSVADQAVMEMQLIFTKA